MESACKSVKVTNRTEMSGWNVINPASEKPKFGRGTLLSEQKSDKGTYVQINGCHPSGYRTWLINVIERRHSLLFYYVIIKI